MLSGRAELWDGQWESEIRERISVEGCDNYWAHPVWTQEVKDMDRRSVDDALRLVGILPPRESKAKVRHTERVPTQCSGEECEVRLATTEAARLTAQSPRAHRSTNVPDFDVA